MYTQKNLICARATTSTDSIQSNVTQAKTLIYLTRQYYNYILFIV